MKQLLARKIRALHRARSARPFSPVIAAQVIALCLLITLNLFHPSEQAAASATATLVALSILIWPRVYLQMLRGMPARIEALATSPISGNPDIDQPATVGQRELPTPLHAVRQSDFDPDRHQLEMALLCEFGQLFQACGTLDEVCDIARSRLDGFCPRLSGALYLMSSKGDCLEKAMAWGPNEPSQGYFTPGECWALRCGRPTRSEVGGVSCAHICDGEGAWHLCLPLMAHGQALGSLYVRVDGETQTGEDDLTSDARTRFYLRMAETLALATANVRLRETLQEQALRDPLTGLYNRRYFLETLRRELHRAEHADEPVTVMMLDIDHFKQFNDTFGHDAGDAALKVVAAILLSRTRAGDFACRYGGEEFALVFPGMPVDVALQRVQMLCHEVAQHEPHHLSQRLYQITLSAGLAVYPQHGTDMDSLVRAADQALYESKKAGRNRVTMAGPPRRSCDVSPTLRLVHSCERNDQPAQLEDGDEGTAGGTA